MTKPDKPCFRNDAVAKVSGKTKYTADLKIHGMLHAVPVYTDYVHAKINNLDTSTAEASPGVVRVITANDVPGSLRVGKVIKDQLVFAKDKIISHGDVVAVVVAESREQALQGAEKIKVDVTELTPILDPVKAMEETSNLVIESKGTNIINQHKIRRGDVEKGFAEAAYIIEQDFTTQFAEHAYMETEGAIAIPRHDGVIEIQSGVQHPFTSRQFSAALLGVSLAEIELVGTPLGGGFGGKDDTASVVCARTALAAKLTGRPVKISYDREWSMRESYKRHPYVAHYKMGLDSQGKIVAVKCKLVADGGSYSSTTPFVTWRSTVQCCGPYQVPNVYCDCYGVHTNNPATGAFRGFGSPQINFMVEQLVELAADKVGITPTEFRSLNMVRQGSETVTGQKLDGHVVSLEEVMNKTLTAIDYENKLAQSSMGEGEELYGIGYGISYRGMSLGAEGMDFCSAIVNCQFDGSILLEVGVHENGQGSEAAMILILAEELGVDKERIRYRRTSTSTIPDGGPSVASRCTLMGGGAVVNAAKILKRLIAEALAAKLDAKPEQIEFRANSVIGNKKFSWDEAMHQLFLQSIYPHAFGVFQAPKVGWDEECGKGDAYFTWVYGCDAVEVSVNKKTGKVKILNYVSSHDIGKTVNLPMLLGQYYGGIAQGIGYGLFEEVKLENGKILNDNFHKYRIPRFTEVPEITGIIVENPDPTSPSKAKGIGEPALELAAAALANAIYRATGKRLFNLPLEVKPS